MQARRAGLTALALAFTIASPASATPGTFEEPIFSIVPDVSNELVAFWNITRDAYCGWEADGFAGPPPVTESVSGQFVALPRGAVVGRFAATRHLELWRLDADATLAGPCEDTDGSVAPWAVGSARVSSTNNDVFHWESVEAISRAQSLGEIGVGGVMDVHGESHRYAWGFRAVNGPHGGFRAVEHSTLTP